MRLLLCSLLVLATLSRCSAERSVTEETDADAASDTLAATVLAVSTEGAAGAYTFAVTVKSPDTGCGRYTDWWEVVSEEGALLYRRVLAHSHVEEQPFIRSGGPVPVVADQMVVVRAHMNTLGYGTQALRGSVQGGFEEVRLAADFAADVAAQDPRPTSCAF